MQGLFLHPEGTVTGAFSPKQGPLLSGLFQGSDMPDPSGAGVIDSYELPDIAANN